MDMANKSEIELKHKMGKHHTIDRKSTRLNSSHVSFPTRRSSDLQVVLGTQVREFIDNQVKLLGQNRPDLWMEFPNLNFYIHRSFSILVLLVNLWIWQINRKLSLNIKWVNTIL